MGAEEIVKTADYSLRGLGFDCQHPNNGSQKSATPLTQDPKLSSGLWGTCYIDEHVCKTHIHIK